MKGFFLTFEGVEGCGKSTQVKLLSERLKSQGYNVLITREPGDGEMGSRIRELLLSVSSAIDAYTELFLLAADRTRHIIEIVRPALEKGWIVISDRYADSSTAYQGYGRGLPLDFLMSVNNRATDGVWPELTLVMDISPEISIERSRIRLRQQNMFEAEGRFEKESIDFHSRVREGYKEIARMNPGRVNVIPAEDTIEGIAEKVWEVVSRRLDEWKRDTDL